MIHIKIWVALNVDYIYLEVVLVLAADLVDFCQMLLMPLNWRRTTQWKQRTAWSSCRIVWIVSMAPCRLFANYFIDSGMWMAKEPKIFCRNCRPPSWAYPRPDRSKKKLRGTRHLEFNALCQQNLEWTRKQKVLCPERKSRKKIACFIRVAELAGNRWLQVQTVAWA